MSQTRERQYLVAQPADHVFRLPCAATRDARPCVQCIEPAHAYQPFKGRNGRSRSLIRRTEEEAERRGDRTEVGLRPKREVNLERVAEQKDTKERGTGDDVGMVGCAM